MFRITCGNCGHKFFRSQEATPNWMEGISGVIGAFRNASKNESPHWIGDDADMTMCPRCRMANIRCPRVTCKQWIAFPLSDSGKGRECPHCWSHISF